MLNFPTSIRYAAPSCATGVRILRGGSVGKAVHLDAAMSAAIGAFDFDAGGVNLTGRLPA